MSTTHGRHYSRSQRWNLVAVALWVAAIVLITTAAWSGNGWAGATGLLFVIGGCVAAHRSDES